MPKLSCHACKHPINSHHRDMNDDIVCQTCQLQVMKTEICVNFRLIRLHVNEEVQSDKKAA